MKDATMIIPVSAMQSIAVLGAAVLGFLLHAPVPACGAAPADGVTFNGTSSHAVVEDAAAFDLDTFSVAAWVNLRQTSGSQVFVNRGGAGQLFTLYLLDGRIRMLVEHAAGQYAHANTPAPPAD